jgi:nitrogen-specific signal transduction histidine kinase
MAQNRTTPSRPKTFAFPLVLALPLFFLLFAVMEGWFLLAMVENEFPQTNATWNALETTRKAITIFAFLGILSGLGWAWVILQPLKRYRAQLDRFAEGIRTGPIEVDQQPDLSLLAQSFNRVLTEMERDLPHRVQAVLDTVSSGILMLDREGRIEWVNPSGSRLFETPRERISGRYYQEVFRRSEALVNLIRKALESESDFPQEHLLYTDRFGEDRELGVRACWVRDPEQSPIALAVTLVDLNRMESFTTGFHRAEQLSSLGKIASGIAHEIRNPLASIRSLSQLMDANPNLPTEKVHAYGRIMTEEIDRINRVLDRLSLLVSNREQPRTEVTFRNIINAVWEMAAHMAKRKKVTLNIQIDPEDLSIHVSPDRLVQAIFNLMLNAIEASPDGAEVILQARKLEDGRVWMALENEGTPIPPSDIDDIFQPFHTTKPQGAGLGLAITDSIIQDHGGRVDVRSGREKTVFTITLPAAGGDADSVVPDNLPRQEVDSESSANS